MIVRRFLSIFYPAAVYRKYTLDISREGEHFFANYKILEEPGYLKVAYVKAKPKGGSGAEQSGPAGEDGGEAAESGASGDGAPGGEGQEISVDSPEFKAMLASLKKGMIFPVLEFMVKEGETSPPKRYTSGSMILAMENAGQLIEDEDLRAQIKGSGIGTSATRAEILKKLVNIKYLGLNKKTQVITPTLLGEMVFDVVSVSISQLLNPELTASWEKGLTYVAEGSITSDEYMEKLERFVAGRTYAVLRNNHHENLRQYFERAALNYKGGAKSS